MKFKTLLSTQFNKLKMLLVLQLGKGLTLTLFITMQLQNMLSKDYAGGSKPTCAILFCPWKRHFTSLSPA